MKKIYLIAALMVAGAFTLFISSSNELSTYSNFAEADKNSDVVKVVGFLSKEKKMIYNPQENPNLFSFHMKDNDGVEREVIYMGKPQDFELSEQIVVTGVSKSGKFLVEEGDMLLKCPSKYKDEEIALKKGAKS